ESRKLVTNKAIVDAVLSIKPHSVLDVGCGEGWLAKEFFEKGIAVTGVDAIEELIAKAKEKVKGDFCVASYDDIATGKITFSETFDAIAINFALMGKDSTEILLASLPKYISAGGKLFIQTLHPYHRKELNDYTSGWKDGSWNGLNDQFVMPYQWYFRTMEDWLQLLNNSGFDNLYITETIHPLSGQLLSIIFQCNVK
ncbi:MAG TPA: methyltransferase domain-containing protein, partial [Chitinophagaceae bacterium]|nr:methyltransferase domain-containing protein [Chitinophagaceae bacterium]